jgi:formylglycine-generating enzyme required for sulfatase activity
MVSTSHGSVYIFRQFSSDLSDLALSSGTLSPAFSSSITNYTVSTANATASMTVTPMAVQANATIQVRVNGGTFANVASSSESAALALNVGSNIVEVQVTAQDGITKTTYSFEVTRRMAAENIMAARIDQRGKITRPAVLTAGGFGPVFAFQQGNLAVWQASGYGRIALFQVAQNAGLATSSHVATIESPDVTYDNPSFGHMLAFGPQLSLFAGNPYTWVSAPHDGRIYQYDISSMASPVFVRKFAESPHAAGYFGSNLAVDGDILITAQGPNGGGPQTRSGAFIYRINADKSLTLLKTQGRNADFMMPSGAAVSGDVCAMMFGTVSGNGTSAEAWVFRVTRVNGVATDVEGPVSIPFSNTTMDATRAQPSGGSSYHAVALKDNRLALGIYGDDVSASDNAVHLYNVSSTGVLTATQEAVLASPGLGASSRFGRRLLFINSGALLVSDPLATRSGTTAKGKVHLYEPSSPGQWSVSRVIEATTTNTAEAFGEFLALDDTQNDSFTMLAVGARTNADNLSADHDIYLFGVNSTNADLSSLTLSSGVLSPTFSSITTSYTASVDNTVSSITLTPTKAQANATTEVRVNNGTYSGVTSGALALNVGANTVEVRVTAQDGITQKIYTVMVTRGNPLRNLSIAQRAGTGLIDITYDLDVTAPVKITMEISSDGGATWAVPANTVSGAVGSSVAPGMGRSIVWNAGADWPQSYSSQMRFRLTVDDGYALIPPGSFVMGRTSGDTDANAPSVTVTVSAFYLQKTETTQAQWDEVRVWGLINGYTDLAVGRGKAANHPVVGGITWWDVVKWCNARSEKEGLIPCYTVGGSVMRTGTIAPTCNWSTNGYRLPSEAEWEKAARGGVSGQRFPWGDTITHSEANYFSSASFSYDVSPTRNSHPTYGTGSNDNTSPVVSFTANGYGLYDIIGNVEEWCWDWYGGSYYQDGATDPQGPLTGNNRVMRGGASGLAANYERCSHRTTNPPGTASKVGLRSARSINSGSATTDIASIDTRVPEIELKQPSGTGLVDGSTTSTWQALPIGALASPVTYLIRNVGEANLLNLGLSKSGTNAADFSISSLASTTLIPGQSTSFTVTFAPVTGVGGTRSATLQVASNDSDENPFDIILTGEAYSTTQDVDNDGMNDWGEYKLSTLGFDWQTPNTGLVSTYYENAAAAGLFTTSQIQNLNVGVPLLQRNPTTSEFTLTIGVNQSSDLKQWTPLPMTVPQTIINSQGKVEFRFTAPDNAAFFRLQTQPSP